MPIFTCSTGVDFDYGDTQQMRSWLPLHFRRRWWGHEPKDCRVRL